MVIMHNFAIIDGFEITGAAAYRPFLVPAVFRVISSIRQATYHFHKVARVLTNPSRKYGGVQWVFSPPVLSLPLVYSLDDVLKFD